MKKSWKIRKDEEGEMGVGTLLIFIAMILVAAVAASVLVTTAYKLQQQAEATGDEALADVATGVKVLAVWATTDGNATIDSIYLKVGLTAGSPGINLENVIIEVTQTIGGTVSDEKTLDYAATADSDSFSVSKLRDMAPTTTAAMMTGGDIFQIFIDLNETDGMNMHLDVQEQLEILIMPKHGIPTYLTVTAPPTLSADDVLLLK